MSNKMKTVQVAKTKVDPRELVNIDIGVEVLQKKKNNNNNKKKK